MTIDHKSHHISTASTKLQCAALLLRDADQLIHDSLYSGRSDVIRLGEQLFDATRLVDACVAGLAPILAKEFDHLARQAAAELGNGEHVLDEECDE